jgi:hypothetical protein
MSVWSITSQDADVFPLDGNHILEASWGGGSGFGVTSAIVPALNARFGNIMLYGRRAVTAGTSEEACRSS